MDSLTMDVFQCFRSDWALVTAGTEQSYNTMTVSWGGLGTLWNRNVATVYVKPVRYTHDFLESSDYFTVSFFPMQYRSDLMTLGTLSGRDGNKIAKTFLKPVKVGETMGFAQAELTLLCKKIYRQDMDIGTMPPEVVRDYYKTEAPHTMYVGEVIDILKKN